MKTLSTLEKAKAVNEDASAYGTFAEIGGGQEVARYFFQAGLASQTIAKTMSAYDMQFSDAIYGQEKSYTCVRRESIKCFPKNILSSRKDLRQGNTYQVFRAC